jgi:hypothetical protein
VVETNAAAVKLWRSLGFVVLKTVPDAFEHPTATSDSTSSTADSDRRFHPQFICAGQRSSPGFAGSPSASEPNRKEWCE